jgi:iron complex outermembrane receptor protein
MEKALSRRVRLLFATGALFTVQSALAQSAPQQDASPSPGAAAVPGMQEQPALAQNTATPGAGAAAPMQRVEITGSSIRRLAAETSLPVQTYNQKDIQRSGVTSVTDFIQQLPVMQGFTVAADSVGGDGGGITTASIHDVGEQYTLVLVNGRRIAPATSGTTIDINSIPLSAVERIEVLTDGASALYGADAIAGVVNFILKKGAAPFTADARYTRPQHPGARGRQASLSKGWGDIETDGWSSFLSFSHQREERLAASQRPFAATGIINFANPNNPEQNLQFFNGSSRSIPPNVTVNYLDSAGERTAVSINPYLRINGECAPFHVDLGDGQCYFDYTTTVEISPEIKRNGLYSYIQVKLGDSGFKAFLDLSFNHSHVYATIAPYPAEFSLARTSPLFAQYVQPYLTAEQLAGMSSAIVKYRLQDLGGRAYDYESRTTHAVAGVDGTWRDWDLNAAVTFSRNKAPQNYVSGFPLAEPFGTALASGQIDPFPYTVGEMPQTMVDALRATQFTGLYNTTETEMKGVDIRASRALFAMKGGTAHLGVGADYRTSAYSEIANPAVAHSEILFDDDQPEFDYKRDYAGVYAELNLPVLAGLEVNASLRYDQVGAIDDRRGGGSIGSDQNATTYKVHGQWKVNNGLMFRAAYGTGFRVATMKEIGQPQADFGVTGGTYNCPLSEANGLANHPLAQFCQTRGQLEVFKAGNANLAPEKSKQWSIGAVWEPSSLFSARLDLWEVSIRNAVTEPSEALIAGDPNKYIDLYTTKFKASTGERSLAIILAPINIGRQENRGLDYDFLSRWNAHGARWTARLAGTHLLQSRYTTPGTSDQWETSMGEFGSNDAVSFRDVLRASLTAEAGRWTHNLAANYRSGYQDKFHDEENCAVTIGDALGDCIAVRLRVPRHYTLDWQTNLRLTPQLELTAGIINLADRKPPLSLRNTGAHQLGYDPRYASPVGRTFYLGASYRY